jgi:hypothetical protein
MVGQEQQTRRHKIWKPIYETKTIYYEEQKMTLILSASDFTFYNDGVLDNTRSGSARLHVDIDSAAKGYDSGSSGFPPSSSYCREYALADADPINKLIIATVASSVDGGAYSGSWGDNAISVRAWVRKKSSSSDIFITLKAPHTPASQDKPRGYSLSYVSTNIRIQASVGSSGVDNKDGDVTLTLATDTWHRIRLDYIPIGSMKDVLNFYTSSAGGTNTETWELVDTLTILNTDGYYITASTPSAIGYAVDEFADTSIPYIDDFDVYVTPVG